MGLNFKLDIGLYRLDQQVACQRYRRTNLDATSRVQSLADMAQNVLTRRAALGAVA